MSDLIQEAQGRLHAQGGRMTKQRRLLLSILDSLGEHPTAEELFLMARRHHPNLNLSTVYRTMRWLEAENLISTRVFAEAPRKERFDAALPSEHHHFMCTRCNTVIEFDTHLLEAIKSEFQEQNSSSVSSGSIMLYGLCPDCHQEMIDLDSDGG
jgi:Fur family ferric uptake transcriptional regulator